MEHIFKYKSEIQEIPSIREDLEILDSDWSIPESELRQIGIIIEELFSNIVRFAFKDTITRLIEIRLQKSEAIVTVEIIDDGIPFNPLEYNPGPISDPASAETGGMGLTLVRTFSSTISYERIGQNNHLTITKRLKSNT